MDSPGERPEIPPDNELFARDDWTLVRKKLVLRAKKRCDDEVLREDLVQGAILECLTHPKEPWRRPLPRLLTWLMWRVRRTFDHLLEHEERFPHLPLAEEGGPEMDDGSDYTPGVVLASGGPTPEEAAAALQIERIYRARLDALARATADDALVTLLVGAVRAGDEPMQVALAAGHSAGDVYNARKRLERAAHAVLEAERAKNAPAEARA